MVQKNGKWGKLCTDNFDATASNTAWNITDLASAVCKSMTYQSLEATQRVRESKDQRKEGVYYEFGLESHDTSLSLEETPCLGGSVVKVQCRHLECGTRPQAMEQTAR